ncbi:hypothetical protein SK854_37645 [Lentzea sp. BCCO 10_0061]|uniref:Uncharacterized protein n=1 Tax=Lentzea sokolovensis TaxID=3095429 RepID=A0ABU4V951_9PSEU|nr:hypothetical protein [Lentzea sp. BCCO 10_0061]MDX8147887.1 hypothetical protein [Lentzea sp. BCCO 10_0061]
MGAKAALVAFGDVRAAVRAGGAPDRSAAEAVVRALRPGCAVEPVGDSELADEIYPGDGFTYVAVFPDATIVCDQELATWPVQEHVLEYAGDRPLKVFAQHSGSGWLAFAEWAADGTLLRSHNSESYDQYELADSVATEMFGFTAEGPPDHVVLHGFRVTRSDHPERDAVLDAAVAAMVRSGPRRMTIGPDGSLVPITEPS